MINRVSQREKQMRNLKTWRVIAVVAILLLGFLAINGIFTILERKVCASADTHTYIELRCWEIN